MTNKEKFLEAAKKRRFDELVCLLDQDDNINAKDEYTGYNALCLFIKNGGVKPKSDKLEEKSAVIDAVYYLMDKGLKIEQETTSNGTNILMEYIYVIQGAAKGYSYADDGYDLEGKGFELFKLFINKGISYTDKFGPRQISVLDYLEDQKNTKFLDYIKEFEKSS